MARTYGQTAAALAASLAPLVVATLESVGAAVLPTDLQVACKQEDARVPVTLSLAEDGGESLMQESVFMHRPVGTSLMQESFHTQRARGGGRWSGRLQGAQLAPRAASNSSSSTDASAGTEASGNTTAASGNTTGAAATQLGKPAKDAFEDAVGPRTPVATPVLHAAGQESKETRPALAAKAATVDSLGRGARFFWGWVWLAPRALDFIPVLLIVLFVACIIRMFLNKAALPLMRHYQQRHLGSVSPFSASAANAQQISGVDEGPFLCPELVVPWSKECKLMVPRLPRGGGSGQLSITDVRGLAVMRASYSTPTSGRGGRRARARDLHRLILSSATGETAFAFCRDEEEVPQTGTATTASLGIYHRSEERFGVLSADGCQAGSGYSVITQRGSRIYFRAAQGGSLNATDDSGRLLADVKPTETHYAVRIGQRVDAGLIVLTVLGVGLLGVAETGSSL